MISFGQIFNSQFFITLGIVVLLIVVITLYTEQKYSEYDHKLTEVRNLVTTIKNELTSKSTAPVSNPVASMGTYSIEPNDLLMTSLSHCSHNNVPCNDLIEISNTELSDSDSDSDSDSEVEVEPESDSESVPLLVVDSDSESESESVKNVVLEEEIKVEKDIKLEEDIKIVNILEEVNEVPYLNVEKADLVETVELEPLVITDVLNHHESNLKKMSYAQLEQLALSQQLIDSTHKLKKKEILKLLQDSQ